MEGDRTLDLRIANAALSQLSYHPEGAEFYSSFVMPLRYDAGGKDP